jgi:ATP-dependent Clp protease ATP-binding subunit ClpC
VPDETGRHADQAVPEGGDHGLAAADTVTGLDLRDLALGELNFGSPDREVGRRGDQHGDGRARPRADRRTPTLNRFGRDLTEAALEGLLDPVIGRDAEITQVLEVLSRRTKNNPVLLGDPGVGKTAIVEGIAARVARGSVPETLRGRRIIALDLARLVAGTKYRGEFEQRFTALIDEVTTGERDVLLFLDELHTLIGAGSGEGVPMDAANMLKPALARGGLQLIGATTVEEYRKHLARDAALERRLQPISIDEPSVADTILILRGLRRRYEAHHKVTITDEADEAAARLSERYLTDRFLPDKAIDLIDRASARVRLRATSAAPGTTQPMPETPKSSKPDRTGPVVVGSDGVASVSGAGRPEYPAGATSADATSVPRRCSPQPPPDSRRSRSGNR